MNRSIHLLQKKLGLNDDGIIGPITARAFAQAYGLFAIQAAHFLGQCHHESMGFKRMEENLNYSATRLLQIFPKYFDKIQAKYYAKNPEAIANRVYANRMGNGPEQSGDGWRYRGRGPLQLTGKHNQLTFLQEYQAQDPELISTDLAFESALWFFNTNRIFPQCKNVSELNILQVSRAINLGNPNSQLMPHGLDDRIKWTRYYFNLLKQ
jgi:putative chitinase